MFVSVFIFLEDEKWAIQKGGEWCVACEQYLVPTALHFILYFELSRNLFYMLLEKLCWCNVCNTTSIYGLSAYGSPFLTHVRIIHVDIKYFRQNLYSNQLCPANRI